VPYSLENSLRATVGFGELYSIDGFHDRRRRELQILAGVNWIG